MMICKLVLDYNFEV